MSSLLKNYLAQIQKHLGYRATWEPNRPIRLGTFGKIHRGIFSEYGHLDELGLTIAADESATTNQLVFISEDKSRLTFKAKGEKSSLFKVIGLDEAGLHIQFDKENGIVCKLDGITYCTLRERNRLAEQLNNLSLDGKWDASFLVITEIMRVEKASVLLSRKKKGELELTWKTEPQSKKLKAADLGLLGEVVHSKGMSLQFTSKTDSTPLYRLSRVTKTNMQPLGERNLANAEEVNWEEVGFDEREMKQN